jgi:amino acid transporter
MQYLLCLALAMGLLISPEALILLGNQMGSVGLAFLGAVIFAGGVALGTVYSTVALWAQFPGDGGESRGLQRALGTLPAIVLPLCARVVVLVCASTGLLAIAGYVFNEVFVYWFPNLGFSFCVLGLLLTLNLLSPRVAQTAQLLFVAVALLGLLALSALALLGGTPAPSIPAMVRPAPAVLLRGAFGSLLLFVGVDLARFMPLPRIHPALPLGKCLALGILLGGITFCTWGLVSVSTVPAEQLVDSTVPHMVTARMLLGQPGRVVMGIVVLAGVSGAVNALLFGVSHMLAGMASQGLLPGLLAWAPQRAPVALILLALGPAVMMRLGMAGEPATEVYTRAGLVFWLMHYGAVHLAVLVLLRRADRPQSRRSSPVLPILSMSIMALGIVGLLWTDSQPGHLVGFMLTVVVSVSGLSLGWIVWCRRKGSVVLPRPGAH